MMAITLTQTQIIQSLGEALSWFERETNWGVKPAELRHLTGRIGELYVAMITRGQMALETNQHGYDVVSAEGQRISVKTVTTATHVRFNPDTLDLADRVIVVRINVDEDTGISIEELLDAPKDEAPLTPTGDGLTFYARINKGPEKGAPLRVTDEVNWNGTQIRRHENGQITLERAGQPLLPVKPELREIAREVGVALEADNGRVKTTHELGSHVIKMIKTVKGASTT